MSARERDAWLWRYPATLSADQELVRLVERWRVDPVLFSFEALRAPLMPYQAAILLDLADAPAEVYAFYGIDPTRPKRKVLVASGHGTGKTRVNAVAIWWHMITHVGSMRLVTAPTSDQLTGRLMGECRKLYRRLRAYDARALAGDWEILTSSIVNRDPAWGDWSTLMRTAREDKPESLQGAHALDDDDPFGDIAAALGESDRTIGAGGILIIIEEASGVSDEIRRTLTGALSESGARLLAPGNPTRADGWFAADLQRPDRYAVHHLDCRMSSTERVYALPYRKPTGECFDIRLRGFVRPAYWEEVLADCDGDEDADYFRVRVRGLPPRSNVHQVIRREWVQAAKLRAGDAGERLHPVVIGLDFGLASDKHAIAARQGHALLDGDEWLIPDNPDEQLNSAYARALEWVETFDARILVGDSNGVGAGVMARLSEYFAAPERRARRVRVVHYNAGAAAADRKRYVRRRDEMWYRHARKWLADPRCSLPDLPGIEEQLCAPGFEEGADKRIQVESKRDIKKRTGQASGNLADALLHTLMVDPAAVPEEAQDARPATDGVIAAHLARYRAARTAGRYIR